MGSNLPDQFLLAGIGNGSYQAGLYAAKNPDKVKHLLLMASSKFCPEPRADVLEKTRSQLINSIKEELMARNPSQSKSKASTIAEHQARVLQYQDHAQVVYLKVFETHGPNYNPLRNQSLLANEALTFSISVLCGASGEGGTSDCESFIKVNQHYPVNSLFLIANETDESLSQNVGKVVALMKGYFTGEI